MHQEFLTPPEAAKLLRVQHGKIMAWIRSSELAAVNVAANKHGRPLYRIAKAAWEAFLASRANAPLGRAVRRKPKIVVKNYFAPENFSQGR